MSFDMDSYREMVSSFYAFIKEVPEDKTGMRLAKDKWSLNEIIGHLIDSATNNHQRFVRLQLDEKLTFPGYHQEEWISVQKYITYDWHELVELWYHYNKLMLFLIETVNPECLGHNWITMEGGVSLEWLMNDYFTHMKWHIDHFKKRLTEIDEE